MSAFHRRTHFQSDAHYCKCGYVFAECMCHTKAIEVYQGSDGALTKRYYTELEKRGPAGELAVNLFRAQKCSTRAKVYRGRRFKNAAYDVKQWAMSNLVTILKRLAGGEGLWIIWGWKEDPTTVFGEQSSYVLYVELPSWGQVSFHSPTRGEGPEYPGEFDGQHKSAERIIAFCDQVYQRADLVLNTGCPPASSAPEPGEIPNASSAPLTDGSGL